MSTIKPSSPHSRDGLSTSQIMQLVIFACVPGIVALTYFFGWGNVLNIIWLSVLAVVFESAVLLLRHKDIKPYLSDYSAIVTAILLGISIPPGAPWWIGLTGIGFAIIIAKHLYGGLGYNPFNPAMVAYVVLLISFPQAMTTWTSPLGVVEQVPNISESFTALFSSSGISSIDAMTGATALDEFKQQRGGMLIEEFWSQNPLFGNWSGIGWEWVNLGFLAGGLFLHYKKIISWHIPTSMLISIALLAALFYDSGSSASHGSIQMHLFGGATMLGAFFIATDPVTAATTPKGKVIYGALIGCLVYIIRVWGNYPEGVAFAVLLGNFAAPLIDHFTLPKTVGH